MYLIEDHYYTINKTFLKALGVWPHEKSHFVFFKRFLFLLITVPHLFMQLSVFFTMECTMVFFLKVAAFTFPLFGMFTHYCSFIFNSKAIINLHHQIREDWKLMRDQMENNIIRQNAHHCQIYIHLIFSCIGLIIISTAVIQLLPVIFDIFFPLDKPRPRELLIAMEYFFVQKEYFYCKVLYELVFFALCWIIACSTSTQLLGFIFHSFGMFKIARYRIENTLENCVLHIPHPQKEYAICITIMHAAIAHHRAMEFSYSVLSSFHTFLCFITSFFLVTLIINLYGIVDAIVISRSFDTLLLCSFSAIGILVDMFVSHFIGQKLTDCHRDLSIYIYGTSWYLMPVSSQNLILFLIRRTNKDFVLSIGNMFAGKLENFALVVKAAMSYVVFLYNDSEKE